MMGFEGIAYQAECMHEAKPKHRAVFPFTSPSQDLDGHVLWKQFGKIPRLPANLEASTMRVFVEIGHRLWLVRRQAVSVPEEAQIASLDHLY
jgi:hypothetical protein